MKNYVGFVRDHSASMRHLANRARIDYNDTIAGIKESAIKHDVDTVVSIVELGYERTRNVRTVTRNSSIIALKNISNYEADGAGTPLYDAIGEIITQLENVPDANDPDVSFLVFVTTDGAENSSVKYNAAKIVKIISELQKTDRWTFVFRVPADVVYSFQQFGIPAGNIQAWEQTDKGMEESTVATQQAFSGYYSSRALGAMTTSSFFTTNAANLTKKDIKKLTDISNQVEVYEITSDYDGHAIKEFVEDQGYSYVLGCAFYELKKKETIQGGKQIAVRDKTTGAVYGGASARDLLGLPVGGDIKVSPGDHGNYEIYVQSTSVNRKLYEGMGLMIVNNQTVVQ